MLTPCNFLHGSLSVLPGHFPLTPEVALYPDTVPSYDSHNELLSRGLVPYPLFQAEAPGLNSEYIFRRPCLAYGTARRPGCEDFYHDQVLPGNPAPRSQYSALCFLLGMDPLPGEGHITGGGGGPFRTQLDLISVCVLVGLG